VDAGLQVGSHQSRAEGQNLLPRLSGHASCDAAQDMTGLLGCEGTLVAHVQLFINKYAQVLLVRAILNPFNPQPVLVPGVAPVQVQDPTLVLGEPHEVHMGSFLKLVQVPLDGIPCLRHVDRTTQISIICKLAEGALSPTVCVIAGDIQQSWSQYRPLKGTTFHPSLSGHSAIDYYCLDVTNQYLILQTVQPSNLYLSNLWRRMLWGSTSKALQKSK